MSTAATIEPLLQTKEVVVCCGSGGVGKTTTAASAAAMAAIHHRLKVLVVTVDPAKRLANALGIERFGNTETRVPDEAFARAGITPAGELWAAMLDTKQSWDDLIRLHAPDEATRDAILTNALYRNISSRFVQSHDYVAMERLYELHACGRYDLIVVDTPPTRNAVDFLDAPARMADFFSSRLLRWLIAPYRSRVVGLASKPFYAVADRILGTQFLGDIAEFFILFQSMYDGFVERSEAVSRLLSSTVSTFLVVSTLETAPAAEAAYFMDELTQRDLSIGALVLNKSLPSYLDEQAASELAQRLARGESEAIDSIVPDGFADADTARALMAELGENYLRFQVVAAREGEQAAELSRRAATCVRVPYMPDDIGDIAGLARIGGHLFGDGGSS